MIKLSYEELNNRLIDKFGTDYEFISEYTGIDSEITIKHNKCGNVWEQRPYNFFKSKGCKICNNVNNEKLTQKEYKDRVFQKYGDQYTILSDYINAHEQVKFRHNYYIDENGNKIICNHEDSADATNFLHRIGKRTSCKYCRNNKHFKSYTNAINSIYKFCVYKHINKYNNKVYIGITSQSFKNRWNNGNGYLGCNSFMNAIKKYGWNNFEHYYLYKNNWIKVDESDDLTDKYLLTYSEAAEKERYFIEKYKNDLGTDNIYNITNGGEGTSGLNIKAVKQFSFEGILIAEYDSIKEASEKTNISNAMISSCCNHNAKTAGNYIFKFSDDNLPLTIPETIYRKNIAVEQYNLNGKFIKEYSSATIACKETGINNSLIASCCRGQYNHAGEFQWKYKDDNKVIGPIKIIKKHMREILQYDLKGKFIKKYNSISEAERINNITSIFNSCNGMQPQAGGYIWLYADEKNIKKEIKERLNTIKEIETKIINSKKVFKYDIQGNILEIYESVKSCAKANNIDRNTISRCCNEQTILCNGYIYLYEDLNYKEKLNKKISIINNDYFEKLCNRKKVEKCDLKTMAIIKIYNSVKEAAIDNNLKSSSSICACCNSKSKSAAGFFWRYVN